MKITKVSIKQFRGFQDVEFELGSLLTAIAGQNGTQKTTMLGLLSQTFSITDKSNPMFGEKPLSGGSFKSAFSEKFKISEKFDIVGSHEWTMSFDSHDDFTIQSIKSHRENPSHPIRFWKKGDKTKGSGYIQLPVIYLSLKRLLPIGEDDEINNISEIRLTEEEIKFYNLYHNKILILTRREQDIISADYLSSKQKQTIGVSTDHYDRRLNSAGQDNIGKMLLAIISFKRLQSTYPQEYKGGILVIDEIDATLYPGSQIKLMEFLVKFASDYNIQVIFTTHSLIVLEELDKLSQNLKRTGQNKICFLQKNNNKIIIKNNIDFNYIKHTLEVSISDSQKIKKIDVYTEDKENIHFVRSLLGTIRQKNIKLIDVPLGCSQMIDLSMRKIPSFLFPNAIIILDGDVRLSQNKKSYNKAKKIKNILFLPTNQSPEQLIASYIHALDDEHVLWKEVNLTQQICFRDYTLDEVLTNREKAKKWYNDLVGYRGANASKIYKHRKKDNQGIVDSFLQGFDKLIATFL